ncbi:MAG: hypothetical protein QXE31_01975 [Candidatus Woesearchaeota archaeon]
MAQIETKSSNYFYLKDGRIIKTIEELPDILENTSDQVFYEHVNLYKNDFAKWVYEVFNENELSKLLGNIKSKEETIRTLRAYLKIKEQKKLKEEKQNKNENINENLSIHQTNETFIKNTEIKIEDKKKEINETSLKKEINEEKINETQNQFNNNIKKEIQNNNEKISDKLETTLKSQETIYNENNTENPDDFFKKNPIIIDNIIEAKKENIVLEPLTFIDYDKNNPKKTIEIFKDTYAKAYQRMSFLRKSGFDTSLVEIMLFRVLPKIKLYESTNEEKDALTVKRLINEVIEELNNLK